MWISRTRFDNMNSLIKAQDELISKLEETKKVLIELVDVKEKRIQIRDERIATLERILEKALKLI